MPGAHQLRMNRIVRSHSCHGAIALSGRLHLPTALDGPKALLAGGTGDRLKRCVLASNKRPARSLLSHMPMGKA